MEVLAKCVISISLPLEEIDDSSMVINYKMNKNAFSSTMIKLWGSKFPCGFFSYAPVCKFVSAHTICYVHPINRNWRP